MRLSVHLAALATLLCLTPTAPAQWPGVEAGSFFSDANQKTIPFNIYLPPGYGEGDDSYPVVYFLHGAIESQNSGLLITGYLNDAITAGDLPPLILVLGTDGFLGSTGYKDWPNFNAYGEQAILELVAFVDANYRTIADREARAIEGFSLGGLGTMFFASKYPEMFCSALTTGGALADQESYDYVAANADFLRDNTALKLCIGSNDALARQQNERFSQFLDDLEVPHGYEVVDGATHSIPSYYQRLGAGTMAFHAARFFGR